MVARLTIGKKKYAEHDAAMRAASTRRYQQSPGAAFCVCQPQT